MIKYGLTLSMLAACISCAKEPQPIEPPVEPTHDVVEDVYGRVTDQYGNPVAGALVSDGYTFTRTDSNGEYCITSAQPAKVRFATVSYSADYAPVVENGVPVFYTMVPPYQGVARKADIKLTKLSSPVENFSILMTADPQVKPVSAWTESLSYTSRDICRDMFDDLISSRRAIEGECIGICLGDIANNNPVIYPQYCNGMRQLGIPFFNVIGNHDHIYFNQTDDDGCAREFENIFGPRNYSFDMGSYHFIMMDDCIFEPQASGVCEQVIIYGLEDAFLSWLKEDLSHVDKTTPVMICMHAPLTKSDGGIHAADNYRNVREFFECFAGYEKVYGWFGHTHVAQAVTKLKDIPGIEGFESHTLSRTTGLLPTNEYTCADGNPRGHLVIKVSGKDVSWQFHPNPVQNAPFTGEARLPYLWRDWDYQDGMAILRNDKRPLDDSYQMHAYKRGAYGDDCIYANVFLWDDKWETPYVQLDGTKIPMTRDCCYDLGYKEIVEFFNKQGLDPSAGLSGYTNTNRYHIFYAKLPADAKGMAEVSVKDRFGNTFTSKVSADPAQYDKSIKCVDLELNKSVSTFELPTYEGYKLETIICRPADNAFKSQKARIVYADGSEAAAALAFCGNCTDSWTVELKEPGTIYKLESVGGNFSISSLRLLYRQARQTPVDGTTDGFEIEDGSDIIF